MNKENLHSALILLMSKLEDIKDNPMQDKTFVAALTEVLRYFRDNGELREALKMQALMMEDIQKSPFCKGFLDMLCSKMDTDHPDIPRMDIDDTIKKISSDEFIEERIKRVFDD